MRRFPEVSGVERMRVPMSVKVQYGSVKAEMMVNYVLCPKMESKYGAS